MLRSSHRSLRLLERLRLPGQELAALDRLPRAGHEIEQEAQIMQAEQPEPEDLALADQVAEVGAAEAPAGRAPATFVEGPVVAGEAGVAQVEPPRPGQGAAGARGAGRQDAVEEVDSAGHHLEHALRVADAHEVARLVLGQQRRLRRRLEHRLAVLAYAQPADRVAVEVERDERLARAAAELRIETALGDREAELARRSRQVALALGPERRPPHRLLERRSRGTGG